MKGMKSFLLSLAVTLCLGPLVLSAQTSAVPPDQGVTGRVVSQTGDTLVVQLPSGERSVRLSSSLAAAAPFAVGSQVTLTYREVNGEWVASQVVSTPAGVPSASTDASTGATGTMSANGTMSTASERTTTDPYATSSSATSTSTELPRTAGGEWTLAALGLGIAALGLALKRAG